MRNHVLSRIVFLFFRLPIVRVLILKLEQVQGYLNLRWILLLQLKKNKLLSIFSHFDYQKCPNFQRRYLHQCRTHVWLGRTRMNKRRLCPLYFRPIWFILILQKNVMKFNDVFFLWKWFFLTKTLFFKNKSTKRWFWFVPEPNF